MEHSVLVLFTWAFGVSLFCCRVLGLLSIWVLAFVAGFWNVGYILERGYGCEEMEVLGM